MRSFKKWMKAQTPQNQATTINSPLPNEVEHDNFAPDDSHIQHALNMSNRVQGFFPAFRSSIKDKMILKTFSDILNSNMLRNGFPLNYQNRDYLSDEARHHIARIVKLPLGQIEDYTQRLKSHFLELVKEKQRTNWDGTSPEDSFPGASMN